MNVEIETKINSKAFNHSLKKLKDSITGDLLTDSYNLGIYATDASLYQIKPHAVLLPANEVDVMAAIRFANEQGVSILPRGGGTSLAGQTVGQSIIVDFSKYLTSILEFNAEKRWVRVQPGISRDELNLFLQPHGLLFAPDPATSSRANIGGMVGNNSSGTKSILYGKTIDHLLEMKVVLADGQLLQMETLSTEAYESKCQQQNREGEIYRGFRQIVFDNAEEIEKRFPKVMRRVGGYPLDEFIGDEDWNLAKIFCGSEGTLGLTLEVKLNLEVLPKHKAVCVVHFDQRIDAIKAVSTMLKYNPAAVEILDKVVIENSKINLVTKNHCGFIEGSPESVQIVEFYGDDLGEIRVRATAMIADLKACGFGYAYPFFYEGSDYNDVWTIRKKGLGLILGKNEDRKAIAFIEDAAIPIPNLPAYITEITQLCDAYKVNAAMYAHASVGVIHVRPMLDMRKAEDIRIFEEIAEATMRLVKKYGGSLSGEHGDGMVRSPFIKEFFGDQLYAAFKEVKALFDPNGLMNPGKIVDAEPIAQHLRYGTSFNDKKIDSVFKYTADRSFEDLVHLCSGVGECRKKSGGVMCPSFKATHDEVHSTRGRANALRLAMSGQMEMGLNDPALLEVMDLCLSCKACKSECPSNVDMAKLKSEVLQMKYDRGEITLRERMINKSADQSKIWSGVMAPIVNTVLKSTIGKMAIQKLMNIDKRRTLPLYANQSLSSWFKKNYSPTGKRKVALFADTYINYHEIEVGIAAIQLLDACGYAVDLVEAGCCQRPRISNGFLRDAKKDGTNTANNLKSYFDQGIPVLVLEPSCASALTHDLPDLIDDAVVSDRLSSGIQLLDIFLAEQWKAGELKGRFTSPYSRIHIHGHCHQKTLYDLQSIQKIYQSIPNLSHQMIDAGCCGMAGSFGYEREHYEISKKVSEDRLLPYLANLGVEDTVVASGFSCRHQIGDFAGKKALHWVTTVGFAPSITEN